MQRPARPGRPRNVARRLAIRRAALAAFGRGGYGGATMHEIAAGAGISDSLLSRYFPTKRALLDDLATFALDAVRDAANELQAAAAHGTTVQTFLRSAARILVEHYVTLNDWYAVGFTLPLSRPHREAWHRVSDHAMDVIAARLRATGMARDASAMARTFAGAALAFVMMQLRLGFELPSPAVRGAFVDELVQLIADAIAHGESSLKAS